MAIDDYSFRFNADQVSSWVGECDDESDRDEDDDETEEEVECCAECGAELGQNEADGEEFCWNCMVAAGEADDGDSDMGYMEIDGVT